MKQIPIDFMNPKALGALSLEERTRLMQSMSAAKNGEAPTAPQDIANKLKVETARLNKDKKITFRVTADVADQLESLSKSNGLNMSRLVEAIVKEWLRNKATEYAHARFLATFLSDEIKQQFLKVEAAIPSPEYRMYTNLFLKYPNAQPLEDLRDIMEEMQAAMKNGAFDKEKKEEGSE